MTRGIVKSRLITKVNGQSAAKQHYSFTLLWCAVHRLDGDRLFIFFFLKINGLRYSQTSMET